MSVVHSVTNVGCASATRYIDNSPYRNTICMRNVSCNTFLLYSKQNYLPFPAFFQLGETLPTAQSKSWYSSQFMVPQKTAVILEIEFFSDNQLTEDEFISNTIQKHSLHFSNIPNKIMPLLYLYINTILSIRTTPRKPLFLMNSSSLCLVGNLLTASAPFVT